MALNRRYSAYLFAGTAMRTAIVIGLHINVPESQLPDAKTREHRNRLFWTAYVVDRAFASSMNHPPAIQDDEIDLELPSDMSTSTSFESLEDPDYHIANIKLASLLSTIIRSIYRVRKQPNGTCADLSSRAQDCLKDLQSWYDALPRQLQIDDTSMDEYHELKVVSLHLFYHQVRLLPSHCFYEVLQRVRQADLRQCVILATRPLLLNTLRLQISASRTSPSTESAKIPSSAKLLSQECIRCARNSTRLLTRAWIDGTFLAFDCFFAQYLFSSLIILSVSSLLDEIGSRHDREAYEEATHLLEQLKTAGNLVAQECSHHVDAIESTMLVHLEMSPKPQSDAADKPNVQVANSHIDCSGTGGVLPTQGIPWTGEQQPSLQELLCQPVMDLTSLEAAVREEYLQDTYWPEMSVDT